jgi:hypothetical protein
MNTSIKLAAAAAVLAAGLVLGLAACAATPSHDKPWTTGYNTGQQIFGQLGEPDSAKSDPTVQEYCDHSLSMITDPYAGKMTDWIDGYQAACPT